MLFPLLATAEPIKLGQVSLSFYAVTGGIVQHVLEKEGYTVEVIEGSHAFDYRFLTRINRFNNFG